MSEVGETFVRVRASTTGFKQEAEGSVAAAGRDLGKTFAKAFAVYGIAETIKSVVQAATSHQAAFVVLEQTVKNAGAANTLYGQSIEKLIEKEARLKGFHDEDLASAFQRLVSVTHDSQKAFEDLGKAEDLARFRHIDVAQAALALAKAEQGSASSLQRYGIAAVKVTTAQDDLKRRHDELIASGAKLDDSQKQIYESALKVVVAQDKQASAAATLEKVNQRVGGSAAAFAKTSEGQFERLGVDLHQLKVSIGTELLPVLTQGAEDLGHLIQEVQTFGAPLKTVVDHLGGMTHALEALGAAIVAGKLVGGLTATAAAETAVGTEAAVSASRVEKLRVGLTGLAGKTFVATLVLDLIPKSSAGQSALDQMGLGFLGKLPVLGGLDTQAANLGQGAASLIRGSDTAGDSAIRDQLTKAQQQKDRLTQEWEKVVAQIDAAPFDQAGKGTSGAAVGAAAHAGDTIGTALMSGLADTIRQDHQAVDAVKQQLADTVRQGALSVDAAVTAAKQNLTQIGDTLAGQVGQILDTRLAAEVDRLHHGALAESISALQSGLDKRQTAEQRQSLTDALTTARKGLATAKESIFTPSHPTKAQTAEIAAFLSPAQKAVQQAQQALRDFDTQQTIAHRQKLLAHHVDVLTKTETTEKTSTQRRIDALTDALNKGQLTVANFNGEVADLLLKDHATYANAGKVLGTAFADGFRAQVVGLGQQAAAIIGGPHRAGSGLDVSVTKPLDAVAAAAQATRAAQLAETKAQTQLQHDQTALLRKIANEKKASNFTTSLQHNPGDQTKKTKALVGVTG